MMHPRPAGHRKPGRAQPASQDPPHPVSHGYFKSFDGTRIFYSIEGKGEPLVFCYGLVCSSLHWTYQIDRFRHDHQAIWFDYRGHQNSDIPTDLSSLTIETMARDLDLLLNEIGVKQPVLLGHSMGVNVVLEYYRQHPDRVKGLVLANGTAKRPLETLFHNNALQPVFRMLKNLHLRAPGLVKKVWNLQKANPLTKTLVALGGFNPHLTAADDIALYVRQVMDMDPAILLHLIGNYDSYDATSWLHTIQVPTLILAGEQDHLIPLAQQELMHQLIPGSELAVFQHGSHCSQMDLPELVNQRIEAFLCSLQSQKK